MTTEAIRKAKLKRSEAVAKADGKLAEAIRKAQARGVPMREIAAQMGFSRQALYDFLSKAEATKEEQ